MATDYDKELESIREDLDDLHDNKVDVVKGKQLSTNDFTNEHLRKVNRIETKEYQQEIVAGVAKDLQQANDNHVRLADEFHRHLYGQDGVDAKFRKEIQDNLNYMGTLVKSANDRMNEIWQNWDEIIKEDQNHELRLQQVESKTLNHDALIDSNTSEILNIQGEQVVQNAQIKEMQDKSVELETRVVDVEVSDADQNHRLDIAENRIGTFTDRMTALEDGYAQRDARMDGLDAQVSRYTERMLAIELNEKAQDERIKAEVEKNKRQDIDIACLYAEAKDRTINVDTEGTSVYLQNSREGFVVTNSIEGNTMVNCNKDVDKELTLLTSTVDVSSDNNVTLTEGVVDGGKVDVYLEGNTLVNVSKTKEVTPITHESEDVTGNHVALQGECDGKCRPVVTGNTLWIDNDTEDILTAFDDTKNLRLQSSFEDKVVTQEMVDNGEESIENLGKYKVDYVVTGKNKLDISTISSRTNNGVTFTVEGQQIKVTGTSISPFASSSFVKLDNCMKYGVTYKCSTFGGESSENIELIGALSYYDTSTKTTKWANTITWKPEYKDARYYVQVNNVGAVCNHTITAQLEEGTEATTYEPHKEYKKTFYLNSPLLEGDTIEQQGNNVVHVHRYKEVVLDGSDDEGWEKCGAYFACMRDKRVEEVNALCISNIPVVKHYIDLDEGTSYGINITYYPRLNLSNMNAQTNTVEELKTYLQSNPVTIVYELATPQYEVIQQGTIAMPTYSAGHLDVTTVVPVNKVNFLHFEEELTYLYPSTSYTVQFVSDNAITVDITLGGKKLLVQSIVKGLNKISITTPETLTDNKLIIDGVGANIKEVVVTNTDREFGYFEGMKSVGECEGNLIEISSRNKNLWDINDFDITSGTYSGVEITRLDNGFKFNGVSTENFTRHCIVNYLDKFELGKTYIVTGDYFVFENTYADGHQTWLNHVTVTKDLVKVSCYFQWLQPSVVFDNLIVTPQIEEGTVATTYVKSNYNKKEMTHEPLRSIGEVKDKYILIDGKWYIERNCAEVVLNGSENWKMHPDMLSWFYTDGIKCKNDGSINYISDKYKSGAYSVATNLSDKTLVIEKPDPTTDRLIIKDTVASTPEEFKTYLQQNPVKVVYQLVTPIYEPIDYNPFEVYNEVTHISTNSTIPCNVTVKNHGYNCILKPSTTYTVVSNQGVQNMTTPATLGDSLRFSGNGVLKDVMILEGTLSDNQIPGFFAGMESCFEQHKITDEHDEHFGYYEVNVAVRNEDGTKESNIKFYIKDPLRGIGDIKDKVFVEDGKVKILRNCGQREYVEGDFETYVTDKVNTVCPLEEPFIEEVDYDGIRLSQVIWEKSTMFFDTNIPSTANISYSVTVPMLDQVAEVSSITDDQDALIIDMATQLAVLTLTM